MKSLPRFSPNRHQIPQRKTKKIRPQLAANCGRWTFSNLLVPSKRRKFVKTENFLSPHLARTHTLTLARIHSRTTTTRESRFLFSNSQQEKSERRKMCLKHFYFPFLPSLSARFEIGSKKMCVRKLKKLWFFFPCNVLLLVTRCRLVLEGGQEIPKIIKRW